ncbi:hypothetical protein, partial [Escherichia coli]|uniref:hypothetical protein n=2 Tax=Pseudomonadota TaxID=1224 RepID=UPI001412B8EC
MLRPISIAAGSVVLACGGAVALALGHGALKTEPDAPRAWQDPLQPVSLAEPVLPRSPAQTPTAQAA